MILELFTLLAIPAVVLGGGVAIALHAAAAKPSRTSRRANVLRVVPLKDPFRFPEHEAAE